MQMRKLNFKAYIYGLIKNAIKKVIGPLDVLFLLLSAAFIGLSIFELSETLFRSVNQHGNIAGYLYQILFGFISVLFFLPQRHTLDQAKTKKFIELLHSNAKKELVPFGLGTAYHSFRLK